MQLIPISIESVRLGRPLPFAIMDKDGVLLARKSYIVESRKDLEAISLRGDGLYIDVEDSDVHRRAYVDTLYGLVREEKPLGEIAETRITANPRKNNIAKDVEHADWLDLQEQCNSLLRDRNSATFMERLDKLQSQLNHHAVRNPDGTLFALIYLSATQTRMYSATHAMLVSVMCGLASREVLQWPAAVESIVCKAALSMNLSMTDLQDRLALQIEPLNATQRSTIDGHAQASVELLQALGVTDAIWLETVRDHHNQLPGPLRSKPPAQRLARLVQRADMFAARLAPRASRPPISPAAAMQACYFDENREVDEAGAALIKAVGIYQPGSYVKLVTEEVAVVIKRGANTTTPRVAVLINRSGLATVEPTIRDTSLRDYRIIASVPHRDVKVQINLERLLPLTAAPTNDRPW
jgi:HD-GYP domain-containing protein (c-di-GMP phosphodiesterase class II)